MSQPICKDYHKNSKIINLVVKSLGQVPICRICAIRLIANHKMVCKNCPSRATYLLNTKSGHEPFCDQCAEANDFAVMNSLITRKYGEEWICNKYMK